MSIEHRSKKSLLRARTRKNAITAVKIPKHVLKNWHSRKKWQYESRRTRSGTQNLLMMKSLRRWIGCMMVGWFYQSLALKPSCASTQSKQNTIFIRTSYFFYFKSNNENESVPRGSKVNLINPWVNENMICRFCIAGLPIYFLRSNKNLNF